MKLTFASMSDTHNRQKKVKLIEADVVLHTGDATGRGEHGEVEAFLKWYGALPYKYRIFVPGNHDWYFQREPEKARALCEKYGVILLIDESIVIEGIKIYGSPWTPFFHNWAFNAWRGEDIKQHWDKIPEDTEILLTHGPPAGILDVVYYTDGVTPKERVGCQDLYNKIMTLPKLRYHLFGHLHSNNGSINFNGVVYINSSICDEMYMPTQEMKTFEIEKD